MLGLYFLGTAEAPANAAEAGARPLAAVAAGAGREAGFGGQAETLCPRPQRSLGLGR